MPIPIQSIITLIVDIIIFVFSGFPVKRAAKFLKIKTKFAKILLTIFIAGIIFSLIDAFITTIGSLIATIILIGIYKISFKLKWGKAGLLWILQMIFIIVSRIILELVLSLIF